MARFLGISKDRISAAFEAMTDREKKMTMGFFAALFLILVGGGFYWVFSTGTERREEIQKLQNYAIEISAKRESYLTAKARNDVIRRAMKANRENLFAVVQNAAGKLQLPPLQIEAMPNEKGEERVRFSLRELSIDKLTAFLEEIEGNSADGVTKVIQMNIKTNARAADLVDVQNIIVATWKQG
jgi:type II secretory pathway component PulM